MACVGVSILLYSLELDNVPVLHAASRSRCILVFQCFRFLEGSLVIELVPLLSACSASQVKPTILPNRKTALFCGRELSNLSHPNVS
jgi:hypothetical protein